MPAWESAPAADIEASLSALGLNKFEGGLPLLGSGTDSEYSALLGPCALSAEPARARLSEAMDLVAAVRQMIRLDTAMATRHAAAVLLAKVASRKLDYDARVLPPD